MAGFCKGVVERCQLGSNLSMYLCVVSAKLPFIRFVLCRGISGQLRLSGLFLRRKSDKEFHSYIPLFDYNSWDYEVLLRMWGSEPFTRHLGAFSGPVIAGEDPEETLLNKSSDWTNNLASELAIIASYLVGGVWLCKTSNNVKGSPKVTIIT